MLSVNTRTQNSRIVLRFNWLLEGRSWVCDMEAIFHEKQEGSLCAQHCLNALLQGSYFTPVELATLAQQMDDEERLRMAESGLDSEEYRRFLEQPSGNYDDSGYFSVQVISSALKVWGLELIPYNSTEPRALEAQQCPEAMQAFICNYRDHWFTIRRLGHQWFNLNSLLTGPELLSNTYLAMFLAQLQQEGYSIFVVFGTFPESEADTLLKIAPAVQTVKPRLLAVTPTTASKAVQVGGANEIITVEDSDEELQRALRLSLGPDSAESDPDEALQKALQLSLEANEPPTPTSNGRESVEALQKALRESLHNDSADEDELELERALKMSLECCDSSTSCSRESVDSTNTNGSATNKEQICMAKINQQVNSEEIRQRRLAYLDGNRRQNGTSEASGKSEVNT